MPYRSIVSCLYCGLVVSCVHVGGTSQVPQNILKPDAPFYLKPLPFTPPASDYEDPLPKTKLQTMVKDMFKDSRIEGYFTNHNIRASGTAALFDASIPEAVIQKRTGHKSVSAVRQYERVTTTQNQLVANVLQPKPDPEDQFDDIFSQDDLDLFTQVVYPTD